MILNRTARLTVALAALLAIVPSIASAQIYSWRDESGRLVFADRPLDDASKLVSRSAVATRTFRTGAAQPIRPTPYDELIRQHATINRVQPDLVRAVIQAESAFNPRARSPKGALGLMQLMPAVIHDYGVLDAFNPAENIRAGVAYLRDLLDKFAGNLELALAAYNAGPTAVERYGGQVPPYPETQNYVTKVRRTSGAATATPKPRPIFRIDEVIDGRVVPRFTDKAVPGATPVGARR
jgi:soluble lytic murein transglycosylase-like protein